ncbi:putative polygalacturonase [Dichanthelium oligosanthes]|uniref:Putative polygalacturonase n=1 Tax=Dichanthelium oligosanthes TaxID=888268 RepID=A0A1E5W639_9POAL|nr:putative polygalacturonase [Dichanthelium oligosanthes]
MAGLQRSSETFRRSGSSGLVWEDKNFSGEIKPAADDGADAAKAVERSRSAGHAHGHSGYRATGRVPPAIDPPSPRVGVSYDYCCCWPASTSPPPVCSSTGFILPFSHGPSRLSRGCSFGACAPAAAGPQRRASRLAGARMAVPSLPLAAALAATVLLLCGATAEARVLLTLDDFGAVGDGIANDTQAFLDAWTAACASSEQAVLAVPVGKAYRIWPVQLSGPCKKKLKLLISGSIIAPASPDEWAGRDPMKWLYIYGVDGLSISGGGTIDGMGQQWWASTCKRKKTPVIIDHNRLNHQPPSLSELCTFLHSLMKSPEFSEPCLCSSSCALGSSSLATRGLAVHFEECRGVSVQGVTLQNAQQFQLTFTRCSDVKASFLRVIAPADSPNTDGIHLNSSSHVQITDNLISTGDDCVSMVGNCSHVRVEDISCGPGHGISIGSLGKNRTTDMVENVKVDTCFLTNTTNGVRIKSWQGGMGFARDLRFENVVMKNTQAVGVRKVEFVDIRGTSATPQAISIACSDTVPCRDLELRNVNLTLEGGGQATASCYRASGKSAGAVVPPSCLAKSTAS